MIWSLTKDGNYAVKSGYRVACNINHVGIRTVCGEDWHKIWKLLIPPKVKTFMWRLCRGILPTGMNLVHKHISVPITCVVCGGDVEHARHVFMECPFARACWEEIDITDFAGAIEIVGECFFQLLSSPQSNIATKFCTTLWGIWYQRNKQLWVQMSLTPIHTVESCLQLWEEWCTSRMVGSNHTRFQTMMPLLTEW